MSKDQSAANLEKSIEDAYQRMLAAPDIEKALIFFREVAALIRQRTPARIREMERERRLQS